MADAQSLQAKVLEFMGRPEAYMPPPATVERIETHASVVFLAGTFAYKVKRAVKYPFLDFSTLDRRHAACLNELRVNSRTAPAIDLSPCWSGFGAPSDPDPPTNVSSASAETALI